MTGQPVIAGMDGCRGGWLCVWGPADQPASLRAAWFEHPDTITAMTPVPVVVGADIPIGLAEQGPRGCDIAARAHLGRPRGSSVFPAPIRPMLTANSYEAACEIGRALAGRALSRQAWNIVPLIRAMDSFLLEHLDWRQRVYEVHPEVSFTLWNANTPMRHNKKRTLGRQERIALIERDLPGALEATQDALSGQRYAGDDLLDALAAFWSAARIARGEAVFFPETVERDECGLPMVIRA
ncbi:DUF429 domain-containing protein [Aquisalimonas sp.]|uniref:DUF429 domain-containing protein n=1 Tax=unclassified Aquisalimonas TaxID=2644645 RepID=UPI0025B939B1|nr:DUF429 domain-containing protein [Aquisalimonas sp.]